MCLSAVLILQWTFELRLRHHPVTRPASAAKLALRSLGACALDPRPRTPVATRSGHQGQTDERLSTDLRSSSSKEHSQFDYRERATQWPICTLVGKNPLSLIGNEMGDEPIGWLFARSRAKWSPARENRRNESIPGRSNYRVCAEPANFNTVKFYSLSRVSHPNSFCVCILAHHVSALATRNPFVMAYNWCHWFQCHKTNERTTTW